MITKKSQGDVKFVPTKSMPQWVIDDIEYHLSQIDKIFQVSFFMATTTKKSQEERPVYCRNCYEPMERTRTGGWRCERCGMEHRNEGDRWTTKQKGEL